MLDLEYKALGFHTEAIVVRIRAAPVLTAELLEGLQAAIAYIGPARPIVLTGAGGVFAPDLDPVSGPVRTAALNLMPHVLAAYRGHPRPVVAAINGDALGAGYLLASAADFRVMSGGVVQSVRYHPAAALAAGLVDRCCTPGELIGTALREANRISPALAGTSPE